MASSLSCSLSSPSPTKKKTTNFKKPHSSSSYSEATSFIKRQETVFKKAKELSILCGIEVCVICYGSNGELKTWPEDREKVKAIAQRYSELSEKKRRKKSVDLHEFLEQINKDDSKKKKKKKLRRVSKVKYPVWDSRFDNYSVEQLTGLIQSLERNLTRIQHRIHAVVEAQGQRKIQYTNIANQNQELMMINTMNHPQQRSNQVSMVLYNNGNRTFSQFPVSASASNPAQSLAPIPPELIIYPNSDVGNYSGSLGVQETGINGFQNMNMLTYNNRVNDFSKQIDQNSRVESYSGLRGAHENGVNVFENTNMYRCNNLNNFNVEDYSRFLGVQGTVTNGLQSMNMLDYNYNNNNMLDYNYNNNNSINANGLQLVQFPTQQQHRLFNSDQSGNNIRSLYEI